MHIPLPPPSHSVNRNRPLSEDLSWCDQRQFERLTSSLRREALYQLAGRMWGVGTLGGQPETIRTSDLPDSCQGRSIS